MSQLLPGGHTTLDGVQTEAVLFKHDSACFAPGEKRQLVNRSNKAAMVLLAVPYPPAAVCATKSV